MYQITHIEQTKDEIYSLSIEQHAQCAFSISIEIEILKGPGASCQWLKHLKLLHACHGWEKITGIPVSDVKDDFMPMLMNIDPYDMIDIYPMMYRSLVECSHFDADVHYNYSDGRMRRLQISMFPRCEGTRMVCDGVIQDLSNLSYK